MQNSKKPKFLLIGGFASSLINFRGPLLKRLVRDYEVYAAAPFIDEDTRKKVEAIGAVCISNQFERTGLNPLKDIRAYKSFRKQIEVLSPDYVLAYTIKPVIFGLRASSFKGTKRFALITGKGSGFDGTDIKGLLVRMVIRALYRRTLSTVDGVIFQNDDDKRYFQQEHLLGNHVRSAVIKGTGVDLDYYKLLENQKKNEVVKFLFVARLIKEKGISELFEAAKLLSKEYDNFEVQLLGWIDPNPGGIAQEEIENMHKSGWVNYLGTTDDIRPFMNAADVFVLPSYYNEGLPRTIQEAMAMSKPIITTDHPGCRETVEEGRNGFLVPKRDAMALAAAMKYFLEKPEEIEKMGRESHKMAVDKFDVHKINEQLLTFMELTDV